MFFAAQPAEDLAHRNGSRTIRLIRTNVGLNAAVAQWTYRFCMADTETPRTTPIRNYLPWSTDGGQAPLTLWWAIRLLLSKAICGERRAIYLPSCWIPRRRGVLPRSASIRQRQRKKAYIIGGAAFLVPGRAHTCRNSALAPPSGGAGALRRLLLRRAWPPQRRGVAG
jgi:hypothetical protein